MAKNTLEFDEMLRDTYEGELAEELQIMVSKYQDFGETIEATGERHELNSVSKLEAGYRTKAFETHGTGQDLLFGRRWVMPLAINLITRFTKDWLIRKGGFPAGHETFMKQARYAIARKIDETIIGAQYDTKLRDYILPAVSGSNAHVPSVNFYNGGALNGLMNVNWIGDQANEQETLSFTPTLANGTVADNWAAVTKASQVDLATTECIPMGWTESGDMADSGLTIAKLFAAREALETRLAVDSGEIVNIAITPKEHFALMRDEKMLNIDYGFQSLKTGMVSELLGFRFLVTPMVPLVNDGSSNKYARACPVWKSEDLAIGNWQNVEYKTIDMTNINSWDEVKITAQMAIGAARKRKDRMITILCDSGKVVA